MCSFVRLPFISRMWYGLHSLGVRWTVMFPACPRVTCFTGWNAFWYVSMLQSVTVSSWDSTNRDKGVPFRFKCVILYLYSYFFEVTIIMRSGNKVGEYSVLVRIVEVPHVQLFNPLVIPWTWIVGPTIRDSRACDVNTAKCDNLCLDNNREMIRNICLPSSHCNIGDEFNFVYFWVTEN